jgi:4-hydroxy-tetrahydrodipicolinate synthase
MDGGHGLVALRGSLRSLLRVPGLTTEKRRRILTKTLSGVIAAIATPIDENGAPNLKRATDLARHLLDTGCDGLNVLGSTGEATSFARDERMAVMSAYKASGLPLERLMVGTGAAAVADAVALTKHAAELGFGGALVLPPFYYKGLPDDGLVAYIDTLVTATAAKPVPLYLYHYPQLTGLPWHAALVKRLIEAYPARIVGLKDSSGDMAFARSVAALSSAFAVFPSTEACLIEARGGAFAGCISATANLNADLCARAWRDGDAVALEQAVTIRKLFEGRQLVPGVKALLSHIHGEPALARVKPPLSPFAAADRAIVFAGYDAVRAKRVA